MWQNIRKYTYIFNSQCRACGSGIFRYVRLPYEYMICPVCVCHDDDYINKPNRFVSDKNLLLRGIKRAKNRRQILAVILVYWLPVALFGKYYYDKAKKQNQ